MLNGVLQNAPLDLNRASARITFNGEHGALEFLNAAAKDVDLSLKGDLDFRNTNDVSLKISSAVPVFDTTISVQDCVRGIQIEPIDVTLAPTVQQIELRGDLFGNNWKLGLIELGTSAAVAMVGPLTREFHFCTAANPPGEVFTFSVHPRPQPTPAKAKKRARSR